MRVRIYQEGNDMSTNQRTALDVCVEEFMRRIDVRPALTPLEELNKAMRDAVWPSELKRVMRQLEGPAETLHRMLATFGQLGIKVLNHEVRTQRTRKKSLLEKLNALEEKCGENVEKDWYP